MDNNKALDWDDELTAKEQYTLLPPGEYDYTVGTIEKGRFNGSDKMPACPFARVNINIEYQGENVPVSTNLFLTEKTRWKISEFYMSIGYMKKGETKPMYWNFAGWTGKVKIKHREYNGSTYNDIDKFLPKEQKPAYSGFGR